ncbi:uncharacterized protein LOC128236380 [Mya arenaria]|uniref:uncharacterized protein LOC128236380 n=1 Tax=Mya arenaria TaxID=6604 RepID=UPI0022E8F67F|nr:uncharacterized protein LOC128236380 [Mya arenaria]
MEYNKCISAVCFLFLISVTTIDGVLFESVGGSEPVNTMQFSLVCSNGSGSGVDFFKDGINVGSCIPNTPVPGGSCLTNTGYSFLTDGATTYTFIINDISSSSCGTYKCQYLENLQEASYQLIYNKFSTNNTSLSPQEPTAGESGALNITTACLFPNSDESLTINWYKTYQDGKADEAMDSSFEIYNETQTSTCSDTCGTGTDAKLVIGCRYTPPSNPGTGFQIKVEVMHKAYTDKLYWTFAGTYYAEVDLLSLTL